MKWLNNRRSYVTLSDLLQPLAPLSRLAPLVEERDPEEIKQSFNSDGVGYICCGMRRRLDAAKYMVLVWINVDAHVASSRLVLDVVMWRGSDARTIGERIFSLTSNEQRVVVVALNFELTDPGLIEVRVWSDVNAQSLTMRRMRIHRINDVQFGRQPDFAGVISATRAARRPSTKAIDVLVVAETAGVELWLSCEPTTGDIFLCPEGNAGSFLPLQVVDVGAAAPFRLADGRVLMPLPWLWEEGLDHAIALTLAAGHLKKIVDLSGSRAARRNALPAKPDTGARKQEQGTLDVASLLPVVSIAVREALRNELKVGPPASIKLRSTGAADPRASSNVVRVRLSNLDDVFAPEDLRLSDATGELLNEPITLTKNSDVDLPPAPSAVLIFDCGADCGIAEIRQGEAICRANLFSPFPGALAVFLPQDLGTNHASVVAACDADHELGSISSLIVIALGRKNPLSRGVEVGIAALWPDYPARQLPYTQAKFTGDVDYREDAVVLERGSGAFRAGDVPGIELWKHDWGGLCAIAYQGRILIIDLYAPRRERVLLLPSLPDCLLSTQTKRTSEMGDVVHPALKQIFRRMRSTTVIGIEP